MRLRRMAYHELGATARIRRAGLVGHRPVRARSPEREEETVNPLAVTGVRVELSAPEAPLRAAYAALLSADARRLERPNAHIVAGPGPAHRVLFEVDDVNGAARLLGRRGLPVAGPTEAAPPGLTGDDVRTASSVPLGICAARRPAESFGSSDTDITGIDHLVFMCNDRDQAVALFGATLGLDFRLDRRIPDVGAPGPETPESGEPATDVHQMFFRGGEIIFEVVAGGSAPRRRRTGGVVGYRLAQPRPRTDPHPTPRRRPLGHADPRRTQTRDPHRHGAKWARPRDSHRHHRARRLIRRPFAAAADTSKTRICSHSSRREVI